MVPAEIVEIGVAWNCDYGIESHQVFDNFLGFFFGGARKAWLKASKID
jgi:hypothetical protein